MSFRSGICYGLRFITLGAVVLALCAASAQAGPFRKSQRTGCPPRPWQRLVRAGHSHRVAPWAIPSEERPHTGYYVGGGASYHGEVGCRHEGTWGWDHVPWYSRVRLGWWHGRRHQGGEGNYEPDAKNNPLKRSSDH